MSIISGSSFQAPEQSPQEKQLRAERLRIKGYIRTYSRNPKNWSNNMIMQLEQMATQYQIPFKRQIPEASTAWKAAGVAGGIADSVALGFMPDEWYSDESNRQQANIGKIGGAAAQIAAAIGATALSGGAAAPTLAIAGKSALAAIKAAKGLGKVGQIVKQGAKLSTIAGGKTPLGRTASGGIVAGRKALAPFGASKGWKWAANAASADAKVASANVLSKAKSAVENSTSLSKVVKGKTLSKDDVKSLTKSITDKYGKSSKVTTDYLSQLKDSKSIGNLSGVSTEQIVKMAQGLNPRHNVTAANVKKLLSKVGANSGDSNVAFIVKKLGEKNISKLDSKAVTALLKLVKTPGQDMGKVGLMDINKWEAAKAIGLGGFAASSLTDWKPSREELEKQEDPYDPYNS
tara:strand:- start:790 stop:2001 length:1212 start_codon:yes stop_codon:yes gene_type:complete